MLVRNPSLQRLIAVVLVTLVALSAQAWASHIDGPMSHGNDRAHVDPAALDDGPAFDAQGPAQADSGDHCSHGAAHLTGMNSDGTPVAFEANTQRLDDCTQRYTNPAYWPLTEPPIA